MSKKVAGLATAAMAGLFVLSTSMVPALARDGGSGHGGGGGSAHSSNSGGGGGRSMSSNRSSNGPRVSSNRDGARVYGYQSRGHRHRGHGGIGVYGYSGDYGYYNGTCAYEYNRAVVTGSAYWWNRYQECID